MGRMTVNRMYRMVVARPLFVSYITAMNCFVCSIECPEFLNPERGRGEVAVQ